MSKMFVGNGNEIFEEFSKYESSHSGFNASEEEDMIEVAGGFVSQEGKN